MTVFKTFWKVIRNYKGTIILYTVILLGISIINMSSVSESSINFENVKPDVVVVNKDTKNTITDNLVKYISDNSNVKEIYEDKIDDALFYRDVNYVIYIPKDYGKNILDNKEIELEIKSTNDYNASIEELLLTRYLNLQKIYNKITDDENELTRLINENLNIKTEVDITSKLDTNSLAFASSYFNFSSYSTMAIVIFIICIVISSFNDRKLKKRTIISSMNYKRYNSYLLLGSFAYSFIVWILFSVISFFILGDVMFSLRGIIYLLNSLVFTFCSLTIALLISTLVNDKNAINGIVNVVALGSAFLCGAFVPATYLPDFVLKIAHLLPSYWFINSNDTLATIEKVNLESLEPILLNMLVLVLFAILFTIINNIITKKKQKIS